MWSLIKQKGFSLPEITVALGLMGGISLVTMKMMDEQTGNQAYMKGRAEISKAVSIVKNTLSGSDNCRYVLANKLVPMGGSDTITSLTVPINGDPTVTKELLAVGKQYQGFKTESFRITRPAAGSPNSAELILNFRIKSRNTKLWGASGTNDADDRIITERIPLIVSVNTSNRITDCGPVVSESNAVAKEKFCKSLGGAADWIPATQSCEFKTEACGYGEVMVSVTSLGGGYCKPIQEAIDLNELFSSQPCPWSGGVRIINDNGKLRIDCI